MPKETQWICVQNHLIVFTSTYVTDKLVSFLKEPNAAESIIKHYKPKKKKIHTYAYPNTLEKA